MTLVVYLALWRINDWAFVYIYLHAGLNHFGVEGLKDSRVGGNDGRKEKKEAKKREGSRSMATLTERC